MKTKILLLSIWLLLVSTMQCFAMDKPTLAFISSSNKSGVRMTGVSEYIENNLIANLILLNYFDIYERYPLKEVIEAENQLNISNNSYNDAIKSGDFDTLILFNQNNLSNKRDNDNVSSEITKKIGKSHNVDYLFHATINSISNGMHTMAQNYDKHSYSHSMPYLEVVATYRLIRVNDGKIIWHTLQKAKSNNYKVNVNSDKFKNVSFENKTYNERLFIENAEKLTDKVIKQLKYDLDNSLIKF